MSEPTTASAPLPVLSYAMPGPRFIPGGGRAACAIAGLLTVAVLDLVGIALQLHCQPVLANRAAYTQEDLAFAITSLIVAGALQLGALAWTVVCFLMWLHRAHKNLKALAAGGTQFTPGWAVGCWFIPILNWFRPYQVVKEVWCYSAPASDGVSLYLQANRPAPWWLRAWWALFLGSALMGWLVMVVESSQVVWPLGVIQTAAHILAAPLAVTVIRQIDRRQAQRYATIGLTVP